MHALESFLDHNPAFTPRQGHGDSWGILQVLMRDP